MTGPFFWLAKAIEISQGYAVKNGCDLDEARRRLGRREEKRSEKVRARGRVLWDSGKLGTAVRRVR